LSGSVVRGGNLSLDGTAGGTEARNAARVAPHSGRRVPDGGARRGAHASSGPAEAGADDRGAMTASREDRRRAQAAPAPPPRTDRSSPRSPVPSAVRPGRGRSPHPGRGVALVGKVAVVHQLDEHPPLVVQKRLTRPAWGWSPAAALASSTQETRRLGTQPLAGSIDVVDDDGEVRRPRCRTPPAEPSLGQERSANPSTVSSTVRGGTGPHATRQAVYDRQRNSSSRARFGTQRDRTNKRSSGS